MRLSRLERLPLNEDADRFALYFTDGESEVKKMAAVSRVRVRVSRDSLVNEILLQFLMTAREADRDLAYAKHGDAYRDHLHFKSGLFDPAAKDELLRLFFGN